MGLLDNITGIFARGLDKQVDAVNAQLAQGKVELAEKNIDQLLSKLPEPLKDNDKPLVGQLWFLKAEIEKARDNLDLALSLYDKSYKFNYPDALVTACRVCNEKKLTDDRAYNFFESYIINNPKDEQFLLPFAKCLVERKNVSPEGLEVIAKASEKYPIWKGGIDVLYPLILGKNQEDDKSYKIYRMAWPNHKDDKKLTDTLVRMLISKNAIDELAQEVYMFAQGNEFNPRINKIIVQNVLSKGITESNISHIEQGLINKTLSKEQLEAVFKIVDSGTKSFFENKELWFRRLLDAGFTDRKILGLLADKYVDRGDFSEENKTIIKEAIKLNSVSRKTILIVTEHLISLEEEDDTAAQVYQQYISMFPERPQPKLPILLGRYYYSQKRADPQAIKIYEESLKLEPNQDEIFDVLSKAYLSLGSTHEKALIVYERAFVLTRDESHKIQLGKILVDHRSSNRMFDSTTLRYTDFLIARIKDKKQEKEINKLRRYQAYCYLAMNYAEADAKDAYLALYNEDEKSRTNSQLVKLLSQLIIAENKPIKTNTQELEILKAAFDYEKFSADPKLAFRLLEFQFIQNIQDRQTLNLSIRCFEADHDKFYKLVTAQEVVSLFHKVSDFYLNRQNYAFANLADSYALKAEPSLANRYRFSKSSLLSGQIDSAIKSLFEIKDANFSTGKNYWLSVGYMYQNSPSEARKYLDLVRTSQISKTVIQIRDGCLAELEGNLDKAIEFFRLALESPDVDIYKRWLQIELGIIKLKQQDLTGGSEYFALLAKNNPTGRLEAKFLALTFELLAIEKLESQQFDEAKNYIRKAIETDRNNPNLRTQLLNYLHSFAELAFFDKKFSKAAELFDLAMAVLPKDRLTKTYLAFCLHEQKDYERALIQYNSVRTGKSPELDRSQAYAHFSTSQWEQCWKLLLELLNRDPKSFDKADFPILIAARLKDISAGHNSRRFENTDLGEPSLTSAVIYLYDGSLERSKQMLEKLLQKSPDDLRIWWYLGQLYSRQNEQDLAVSYWTKILQKGAKRAEYQDKEVQLLVEVGLAFLEAGYAAEAMTTWAELRKIKENFPLLTKLYSYTISLNAYQIVKKNNLRTAIGEWQKALDYDSNNHNAQQSLGIAYLMNNEIPKAMNQFSIVTSLWRKMIDKYPRKYGHLSYSLNHLSNLMNEVEATIGRPSHDQLVINVHDKIAKICRASTYYWTLGLEKNANRAQIEKAYFRLVKIFNPERHADDFMLVEEAYQSLINETQRAFLDVFSLSAPDIRPLSEEAFTLFGSGSLFEIRPPSVSAPGPIYRDLKPRNIDRSKIRLEVNQSLKLELNIGDWSAV